MGQFDPIPGAHGVDEPIYGRSAARESTLGLHRPSASGICGRIEKPETQGMSLTDAVVSKPNSPQWVLGPV